MVVRVIRSTKSLISSVFGLRDYCNPGVEGLRGLRIHTHGVGRELTAFEGDA